MRSLTSRAPGVTTAVVLIVIGLVAMIVSALVAMGSNNLVSASAASESLVAQMAAEAGVQHAARRLAQDSGFGGLPETALPGGGANYTVSVAGPGVAAPAPATLGTVPSGHFYLLATGLTPRGTTRRVGWLVTRSSTLYSLAAFGADHVKFEKNTRTDTWDSRVDPYTYAGTKILGAASAHVGTNSIEKDSVELEEGSRLDPTDAGAATGKVLAPAGASGDLVKGTGAEFAGPVQTIAAQPTPPVDMSGHNVESGVDKNNITGIETLDPTVDYKDVTVKPGGTLILLPGTYYMKSLVLEPGGAIQLPGGATAKTTVKIMADFHMKPNSSLNNLAKKAALLEFQCRDGEMQVEAGAADDSCYCMLYAPRKKITLKKGASGGHLFGSMKAGEIIVEEGGEVHFDKALAETEAPGAGALRIVTVQHF